MAMVNPLDPTNNQKERKMSTLLDVLPPQDRKALETILQDNAIVVEDMEDSFVDETGSFTEMAIKANRGLSRTIHFSIHKDVFALITYPDRPARPTNLFLFSDDEEVDSKSIIYVTKQGLITLRPDVEFTLTTLTEDDVVKDTKTLNTNDFDLALWWPSKESGIDVVLVPKGEATAYRQIIQAGTTAKKITLGRALYFIEQLFEIPLGFGSAEQLLRYMTSSLNMNPAEMMYRANIFRAVVQVKSEELIDIAVQADKAFKRLTTLHRIGTPINEVVYGDPWVFYRMDAQKDEGELNYVLDHAFIQINALCKEWEAPLTMDEINGMKKMWHDGCIMINPDYVEKVVPYIEDRYDRRGYSDFKMEKSIDKHEHGSMTYQMRETGGLLIDQHGEKIGMKGHLKTHAMVASGPVARWMQVKGYAFFGTNDAYKEDLAVKVENAMALIMQTKAPKYENFLSAQFLNSIDGALQLDNIIPPLLEKFKVEMTKIIDMSEEECQAYTDKMLGGEDPEDFSDEELEDVGAIVRGFNEVLATYGLSKLPVTDSPTAVYAIKTMLIQKFGFATLSDEKNEDMSNKGFGRNIRLPIPAIRLQVFPRAFMRAAGYDLPQVKRGEIMFFVTKGKVQVAVVNDQDWTRVFDLTGGPDLDDFWEAMLYINKATGEFKVKLQRNPAVYGEYMLFEIADYNRSKFLESVDTDYVPTLDESLLPTQVDRIQINGAPVNLMTLGEFHDVIATEKGEATMAQLGSDDQIVAQKRAMRTYVQMVTIAGFNLLDNAHRTGNWKRMDSRLLLPTQSAMDKYNKARAKVSPDDIQPKRPRGVIQGIINGIAQKISSEPDDDRYVDFHAMVKPGTTPFLVENEYYGNWMGLSMEDRIRNHIAVDQDKYDGAVTLVRNQMEEVLKDTLDQVNRRIYHNYGIKLRKAPSGRVIYNDRESTTQKPTSQQKVVVLKRRVGLSTFFGKAQTWKLMRANNDWKDLANRRRVVKVLDLDQTEFGKIVHNTAISRFVPAASLVRAYQSERLRELTKEAQFEVEGEQFKIDRATTVMNVRKAWMEALEAVEIPIQNPDSNEEVYQFILALLYVLRATPNVRFDADGNSINTHLKKVFGLPVNVDTERTLYSSIFMNWGEEHRNYVAGALRYLGSLQQPMAHNIEDRIDFEQILHLAGGVTRSLFLPTSGDAIQTCPNCGTEKVVEPMKVVKGMTVVEYIEKAEGICAKCRKQ